MKIKKFLSIVLTLVMLQGMLSGMSLTAGAEGAGNTAEITPSSPAGSLVITLVIKAAMKVTAAGYTGVYDDAEHSIDVSVDVEGARITYSTTEDGAFTETRPLFIDAGIYTVYYRVEKEGYETSAGSATVAIAKAGQSRPDEKNLTVTNVVPGERDAGDDYLPGTISGVDKKMEYSTDQGLTWTPVKKSSITGLDAGKVQIRYAETKNYRAGKPITVTVKEQKQEPSAEHTAKIELDRGFLLTTKDDKASVSWGKVTGAEKYRVYADYCSGNGFEVVKTTKNGTSCTFAKLDGKKMKTKQSIRAYVVAYDGNGRRLATSIVGHAAGSDSARYTNVESVTVEEGKLTLIRDEIRKIKPKYVLENAEKERLGHPKEYRYASSDPYVAFVSDTGRITAIGKGSCIIYIYAENGRSAKIKVQVK